MHSSARVAAAVGVGLSGIVAVTAFAQRGAAPAVASPPGIRAEVTARIVTAAQDVLATLDDAGRAKVQFPFEGPQKTRWSNLPSGIFQRQGLRRRRELPSRTASFGASTKMEMTVQRELTIDFDVCGTQARSAGESVFVTLAGAAVLLVPMARRVRTMRRR